MTAFDRILVPYDFSAHSQAALEKGAELAEHFGSELHLIHVLLQPSFTYGHGAYGAPAAPPLAVMPELREQAEQALRDVAGKVGKGPVKVAPLVLEGGDVAQTLLAAAEKLGADLIVMGTHGRTGVARVFLGSVTERTLRCAPCPVLSVQAPEEPQED
jgi:nucleotide-binding universal stress UspA family protein